MALKPEDVEWVECATCEGSGYGEGAGEEGQPLLCPKCMGNGRHPTLKKVK